jgi:DNA-binding MarR family transcriptional regulator
MTSSPASSSAPPSPSTPTGPSTSTPATTAEVRAGVPADEHADVASGDDRLDALDDALVEVRRVLQRPGYRRRITAGTGAVELATLRLLRAVQRLPGAPSIGDVAELLIIDPSTASRLVDRALAAGLLEKRACADDGRRARLHLTDQGDAVLAAATRQRRSVLAEVTGTWDPHDVEHLVGLLAALRDGFDRVTGDA